MPSKSIPIPRNVAKWVKSNRTVPAKVTIESNKVTIEGAPADYRLEEIARGRYRVLRLTESAVFPLGEFDKSCIYQPMSEAARCDLGLIRAAMFDCSYPAPLAYLLDTNEFIHPGKCYKELSDRFERNAKYEFDDERGEWKMVSKLPRVEKIFHTVKEEVRCAICEEAFE